MPSYVSNFLVFEVGDGQYVVCPPAEMPETLRLPTGLHGMYVVTGQLKTIQNNLAPDAPMTRAAVIEWLQRLRQQGCYIRATNYEIKGLEIIDPS